MNLCRRCFIEKNSIKKKDAKHLMSTVDKYRCDNCGEFKTIVIEEKPKEEYYDNY